MTLRTAHCRSAPGCSAVATWRSAGPCRLGITQRSYQIISAVIMRRCVRNGVSARRAGNAYVACRTWFSHMRKPVVRTIAVRIAFCSIVCVIRPAVARRCAVTAAAIRALSPGRGILRYNGAAYYRRAVAVAVRARTASVPALRRMVARGRAAAIAARTRRDIDCVIDMERGINAARSIACVACRACIAVICAAARMGHVTSRPARAGHIVMT